MKEISVKPHTILLMVGPTDCGKSYFCENVLIPQLKESQLNVQYLSSDGIRRELFGEPDLYKHDDKMNYASGQAFDILEAKLKALTSFPINAEFVIVDTTALSDRFRDEISEIAKENHYNLDIVTFDYKDREEYYAYCEEDNDYNSKSIISKHVTRYKREVLKQLNKRNYKKIHSFKNREEYANAVINVENMIHYRSHFLPEDENYIIISDIHGCYNELMAALEKAEVVVEDGIITSDVSLIINGDYIDKGYDVKGVIDFIYDNIGKIFLVNGNHENYVYKKLAGEIKEGAPQEIEDKYFNSIKDYFESDEEMKDKFFKLFKLGKNFYIGKNFIVTHAPCDNKYIGKIDNRSYKKQQSFIYPRRRDFENDDTYQDAIDETFDFVLDQARNNYIRVFHGHVPVNRDIKRGNRYFIDTGCVEGNRLTVVTINKNGYPYIQSVPSAIEIEGEKKKMTPIFKKREQPIDIESLDRREYGRIKWAAKNKVNFISGTMSPSDKVEEENTLESLEQAFDYYISKGIDRVTLQPKYMGSRCNVYLNLDIEKCYATTRNGHLIDYVDLTEGFNKLLDRFSEYMIVNNIEYMLLDTELMPWSALGDGLIEYSFKTVETGLDTEFKLLKETGFYNQYDDILKEFEESNFRSSEVAKMKKKDVVEKFGYTKYKTYDVLNRTSAYHIQEEEYEGYLKTYKRQLELYGESGDLHIKPFMVLKVIYNDGTEKLFFEGRNKDIYTFVGEDESHTVHLTNKDYMTDAKKFYKRITENMEMEGVVVKPDKVHNEGVVPYMKVRNPNYLTLIYGYNYQNETKYQKLIKQKKIRRKLSISMKEWELGKKMLEIPYKDISFENEEYKQLIARFIMEEKNEALVDPRL